MIAIDSLDFSYPGGDFRLRIADLRVQRGEKLAVIGPSGSGKTTLLNLVSGIVTPREGTIQVDEVAVDELQDAARRAFRITSIGFVFQDFALLDYVNVSDNILHPYRISPALQLTDTVRNRAGELAWDLGIEDKLNRFPDALSHGEKQRAAICRALLPEPRVILADEATGNLDPENKIRILDLLFRGVENRDATLLAVTHDHELLDRFDRVIDFRDFHEPAANP
jgi:putative ABC transport system ATP-binding protein